MATELTIGLVVENDPDGLARSAACVFNQTWSGEKALKVVDDGSTDDTGRVLSRLQERYGAMQVIRNTRPLGFPHARNQVLREAEGRYVAWIDAGDLWHPRKLELQFAALNVPQGEPGFVVSSCGAKSPGTRYSGIEVSSLSAVDQAIQFFPAAPRIRFASLLAAVDAFRAVGELDARLSCLAEEEFLMRLVLSGVPFSIVEPDYALVTAGRQPRDNTLRFLAEDSESVWRKHRRAIRQQFGRRAAWEFRRRQRVAIALAASTRDSPLRAARHRAAAEVIGVATGTTWRDMAGTCTRFFRNARRAAAGYPRALALELIASDRQVIARRLLPTLFRLTNMPRRLSRVAPGLAAFVSPALAPASQHQTGIAELSSAELAVMAIAYAALKAGRPEAAAVVLETHIAAQSRTVHPRMLEQLAHVLAAAGRLAEAEHTLQRAIEVDSSNGNLQIELADIWTQMSNWQAATTLWNTLPDESKTSASAWTHARIARAYRLAGHSKQADAIARAAAALHPHNDQLRQEIELCRPSHVDWRRCLVGADAGRHHAPAKGAIDELGFLGGGAEPMSGTIEASGATAPEVRLYVNDLQVASTRAAPAPDGIDGKCFSINCTELLQYLGDGDVLRVVCEGAPLVFSGLGSAAMVYCGLPSRTDALEAKLRQGYVFTKFGHLHPGHTDESKRAALDLYAEVSALIESSTGLSVFPFYGNLLGTIREQDFISHDVGGFDMVVICQGSDPTAVKAQIKDICNRLLERGYYLRLEAWGVLIKRQPDDTILLDLSYAWFNSVDELNVSFGWRFTPVRGREQLLAHRKGILAGYAIRVPGNAEAVLGQLYGPQWQVPDQGYAAHAAVQREEAYLLTQAEMDALREQDPVRVKVHW